MVKNEKVEHYIKIKTHKLVVLRFWVESSINVLCSWVHVSLVFVVLNESPSINLIRLRLTCKCVPLKKTAVQKKRETPFINLIYIINFFKLNHLKLTLSRPFLITFTLNFFSKIKSLYHKINFLHWIQNATLSHHCRLFSEPMIFFG